MNNLEGLLFDLDGTLVDTSRDITANLNRAFTSFGYPQLEHEIILSHVGYGSHFLIKNCLAHNKIDVVVDDVLVTAMWEKFREHYRLHLVDESAPYPGVVDFLQNETRPMGVVSNKPEEFVIGVLEELNLDRYFKFMWGRDTLPVCKPDPQVIRYAAHELGIEQPGKVCMLGDNPVDIKAAKGAGALAVGLASGFTPMEILNNENPDYLFESFSQFSDSIQGVRLDRIKICCKD